jgi:hypothetical protein
MWWRKHESMFPIVDLLIKQMLRIVDFQIETHNVFSLEVYTPI